MLGTTIESWPQALAISAELPTLPLWIGADLCLPLSLEASYTAACQAFGSLCKRTWRGQRKGAKHRAQGLRVVIDHYSDLREIRIPTPFPFRLREALDRLTHTAVRTNIRANGKKKFSSFHWLEAWSEVTDEKTGGTIGMTLTLPDWLYRGIVTRGGVLTIHEDYFLLTGGIERWLYRVARKHAGTQELGWQFTMRQLYEKSGSIARFSDFALDVRRVAQADRLPEYALHIHRTAEDEVVSFIPRIYLPVTDPRFRPPRNPRRRVALGMTEAAPALPAGPIRRKETVTNGDSVPARAREETELLNHQLSLPSP